MTKSRGHGVRTGGHCGAEAFSATPEVEASAAWWPSWWPLRPRSWPGPRQAAVEVGAAASEVATGAAEAVATSAEDIDATDKVFSWPRRPKLWLPRLGCGQACLSQCCGRSGASAEVVAEMNEAAPPTGAVEAVKIVAEPCWPILWAWLCEQPRCWPR